VLGEEIQDFFVVDLHDFIDVSKMVGVDSIISFSDGIGFDFIVFAIKIGERFGMKIDRFG
jgi:hypothetical protein